MELDRFDKAAIEGAIRVFEAAASAAANRDYRKRLRNAELMDNDKKLTEQGRRIFLYVLKHKLKNIPDDEF
jgi:hypothetical protein